MITYDYHCDANDTTLTAFATVSKKHWLLGENCVLGQTNIRVTRHQGRPSVVFSEAAM